MALKYLQSVAARRRDYGDDIQRGIASGEQIAKLIGGLAGAIKSAKQDAAANALMTGRNISDQPGAGVTQDLGKVPADTAPTDESIFLPDASAPVGDTQGTVGGLLGTGGVAEMKMRQQFESDQLDTALKKAKLADYIASTQGTGSYAKRATPAPKGVTVSGATSPWSGSGDGSEPTLSTSITSRTGKTGKTQKYEPGSSDVENDPSSDDPTKIRADYEAYHPGGDFGDFTHATVDPTTGDYVIKDKDGGIRDTIPKTEGDIYRMRMDAAKRKAGIPYTPAILGQASDPSSTLAPGTQGNPIIPQGQLHLRSLPAGTSVQGPDGQKYQIKKIR